MFAATIVAGCREAAANASVGTVAGFEGSEALEACVGWEVGNPFAREELADEIAPVPSAAAEMSEALIASSCWSRASLSADGAGRTPETSDNKSAEALASAEACALPFPAAGLPAALLI
jgi:hypothetical protein